MSAVPALHERLFAVLNARAGSGRARRAWDAAARAWGRDGLEVAHAHTEGPGHAETLAADAVRAGWPVVVAMGGDGTIHEVVNGLLRAAGEDGAPPPLGIVPCGSGNDFVKALGTPTDPEAAARALARAPGRPVDAGRVNQRHFVNGVGVGFDARVAFRARSIPWLKGTPLYGTALLAELRRNVSPSVRLRIDGVDVAHEPVTLITVSNGPSHGGGFLLCPAARADDGALDVLVAASLPRRGILRFLARSLKGSHGGLPGIRFHLGRSVEITSDDPLPVHVDGELLDHAAHRLAIDVLPGRLKVLA